MAYKNTPDQTPPGARIPKCMRMYARVDGNKNTHDKCYVCQFKSGECRMWYADYDIVHTLNSRSCMRFKLSIC